MKQVQFQSFGMPSSVVKCVDTAPLDAPSAWEVLVDIEAFPINVADLAVLSGRYGTLPKLPSAIGMEAVGMVQQVGSSVTSVAVGDRVMLLSNNNWAQQRKVPATTVYKIPPSIDPIQACMMKVNPATAHLLLTSIVQLQQSDWVIQTAPLGSVGQCVIKIAKCLGFRTINIVRRAEQISEVQSLGGDACVVAGTSTDMVNAVKQIVGHDPLALALDAVAGSGANELAQAVSNDGTIVCYGMLSNEACMISPEHAIFRNVQLRGFWLSKLLNRLNQVERNSLYDTVSKYFVEDGLKMKIDSVFKIQQIADAVRKAEQGGRDGKVIVQVR